MSEKLDKDLPSLEPISSKDCVDSNPLPPSSKKPSKAANQNSKASSKAAALKPSLGKSTTSTVSKPNRKKPSPYSNKRSPLIRALKKDSFATKIQTVKFGNSVVGSKNSAFGRPKVPSFAVHSSGRRKSAIARVWIWKAVDETNSTDSIITVNERDCVSYFSNSPFALRNISLPFATIDESPSDYRVVCYVVGGGVSAQSEAVRLAIAKNLISIVPHMKPALRTAGLLTRDSRVVESKKTGLLGARKKKQFSKR